MDTARPTKWRRRIDKNSLRRYVIKEMEDEMIEDPMEVSPLRSERRKMAEEEGYNAAIRPWDGGWAILYINGPGILDGATQACTLGEVEPMVRDYVCCGLDLDGEDEWDEGVIPVRLRLDLEVDHQNMGTRITTVNAWVNGGLTEIVEEITWWREDPTAK